MNRIAFKFGVWFLIVMLFVEIFLFFFLHTSIVNSRVDEEMKELQSRGNSHRDVLEKYFNEDTLNHIAFMESEVETEVIITDQNRQIIIASTGFNEEEQKIVNMKINNVPRNGMILEERWETEKLISTVSPFYVNKNQQGYVYMFRNTEQVQSLIKELNHHFIVAAIITIILLVLTILLLSQVLTRPLIRMKRATEKLSKGDFSVHLPEMGNDELGDLSRSISILAKDLQHLKEDRKEFLASISHELRTPLTYIKGYADIAKRKNINQNNRNQYLSIIYEESEKLSNMIKDLFELAKIDTNAFQIKKNNVDFCSFLHNVYNKMLPAFMERGIELRMDCTDKVFVSIDPRRFEQVMYNLLDNACKYSKPMTETNIAMYRKNKHVLVEIIDRGLGIPEEDLPYIFERFYRVDKSRSRDLGGTGLGLAIVKELIEAQGGAITVSSRLGEGTTFTISLKDVKE
ncbi:ATP-binding protein [Bacillus sp. JJ722]|uniref:ATP-binding protein n=1 Tax=Bacillus sp. JJ722 TaxID=3122973 RepID=UPI0030005B20